jgi:hypothetical protein
MQPERQPAPTHAAADTPSPRRASRFGPAFWLQAVFGLIIAGYGGWMLLDRQWHSPTGFLIACVGVMIVPLGVTRLLGGLGAVGLAVWLAVNALGSFDYIYAALVVFVGGSSVIDGIHELRGKRAS